MNAGGKIFEILSDPDLGKKVKKISDKYNKEVSLVSQDGKNFGTVRQGVIDRLNKFKSFDNFRFKNNAEKEAVENFIKSSTVQVPIGDKEYSFSYNGYKAIQNGDWQNYSPAENEKEGFDAFKSYPMFDLITTGTDGKEKNWGKISYNANEALKNGKTYSSSFGDEMGVLNSYYSEIEKNKPKSYDELYSEAMQRIIDKAKANPSAQGIMNPDIEDPSYYLQFISDIDKEKIWQEFDNKLAGAIKTEADKVHYRTLVQNRMETLDRLRNTEYRDNKEMRNYIDGLYTHFKIIRDTADDQRVESIGTEITTKYDKNVQSEGSEYVPQTDLAKSDNIKINISSLSSAEKYDFINLLHSPSLIMKKSFDLKEGWMSTKADLKNVLWLYLTPEEVNVYNKNYAEDPKKAEKYLEEMEGVLKNRRRVTNNSIAADESAEEYQQGKESPFVGGIASIGRNIGGSIVALGDNIIDLINTGEINTYDDTGMFLRETQALKAGGSQHMKENYGTVAQFAYDTGLSILENALVIATTKGVGNAAGLGTKAVSGLSGATMAMSAASNQMLSVADRGGNTAQILVGGLAAGAAEFIFEKFSIEKLLSPGSGKFVKDILKQSGVEASEELFTEVANIITDTVIMGEKSESNLRARELILNDGLTAEEAMKKVFLENLDRVLQSGVAGGISGGVMSGVTRGAEYGTQRAIEKSITKSIANNATLPNVVKIIGEIEGRNPDYYTSDEAIDTANAVLKMTNGTATKADYALIERSEGARTVILSAEGTKAWDSLKTEADKRMRSAEYGMRSEATPVKTEFTEVKGMSFGDILTDKSKVKSATISDGEIISNGKKVTIDNTSKVAGNVVLDEESYNFRKVNKEGYKAIQTMAKDLGMKVKYVDGLTDSEGKQLDGVITSEGIFINTQSKNPTRWAATHEFSHRMKQTGGKMWQRYQDYVISHLKEAGKYEERYNLKKGAYAESEIDEEIASDYIGEMFADVKELSDFIRRNRKDAFGIRNAYYKVLDKLGLLDEKKKAQAMWAKAYREAMKNSDVEYEDGVKFSKTYSFNKQVDDALNNKIPRGYSVYVGKLPKLLEKCGLNPELPMLMHPSHIRDINHEQSEDNIHYHGIPDTLIKQIPEMLKQPAMIYDSISEDNSENSVCVLTTQCDSNGDPILIVITNSEQDEKYLNVEMETQKTYANNHVDTMYGKKGFSYHMDSVIDNDAVLYVSKNGINKLLNRKNLRLNSDGKLHLLARLDNLRFDTIIHQSRNVVNTNSMQDSSKNSGKRSVSGTRVEMEAPVEETKDLIAMHNITESQLIEALHRGKMIMPSIAVTNKAFTDFGDISVIFRKDTINPENNSENKLYGADAWTPTQTQLKLNPKFDETTTAETLKNLKKTIGKNWSQIFNVNLATFKQTITANKGSVYNAFAENTGMQTAYALEKRIINSVPTKNGKIDVETLKSNLDESLNKDKEWREYKKWLSNISDTVIESYDRASTNDILENMKSQPSSAKTFNLSENGELTVPAAEYSSITEMKKNKNRLSENADADAKAVGSEFISFANDISNRTDVSVKNVVKTINTAFNNRYDSADIIKAFADNGINLSGAQAKVLQGLYKKAVELSTLYFEAKPHRNVGTEEYAMVVVPENTSFELTDLLDKNNVSYVTYDGSTKDRVAKINAVENVKFSKAGTRVEDNLSSEDKSDYNQFLNDNGGGLHTFRPAKEKGWLSQQWITNRSEGNEEIAKSLNKISDIISNDFGVPINNRSFSDEDVAGSFNLTAEAIHTRAKNDIITLSHEVGHLLDKKLKLQKLDGIEKLTENFDRTLAALGYGEKSRKAEAVGEFVRMYLTNKEVAKAFCPEYFEAFESAIEKSDYKKAVEKLSEAVNAYLSAKTSERIDLAISDKTKEKSIRNNLAEKKNKFPELWNKFQYEFVDRYYAIGRAQGKVYAKNPEGKYDAHTLATNSLNSAARSAYILTKAFVNIEGEEIGKSFIDCLAPIADKKAGIRKKNISELNRYLVLKHALEWIDPKTEGAHKKRVFADESLENPEVLKAEIEKIEKDLPGVKEAAENIYQYIRNLKKYWGVDAGLMTQELSDKLDKMYPNYVPFFREGDKKTITGARTNLANQRAPILEASGGEGMIVNPLESIIGLTNKYVKTASRNMAMQAIAHMADNVGGTGFIIERASGEQQSALEGNEILEGKADAPEASPEELRGITTEEDVWTKTTKNGKGFASVLIDGERVWYQINNEQLFNAVADMEPKRLNAFLRGCNVALNVKRALITSNNPLFAATNAVRDAITAYNNIDINNPFSYLRAYFTAFYHVIRKDPNYKRWCAMGGGHSSELSANMDAVKRELGKAMRNPKAKAFSWIIHPVQAIASVNDAIESTPRLMAFEHEMKKSGDVHKAINKADDITTNFKRGGRTAKNLNNMFMFSNAAIQGLDRTIRSFTKNETEHGLRNRIIKYSVVATFFTVLQMAINRRDEESKEDYKNLSSYMKRSNYVISIGGGKFLRIPTAREQDMLRVIIADAVNYAFGNKEAFDGLLGFAVDTLWPWYVELPQNTDGKSMLDIMTEMFINTARNTPFGFLTDFAANYDFTGKPIVSSKYDDVPRKEQYDERTSKLAVWIGKLTNESPLKIDYIINSNFGILGTINKSLFPMDKSQKDKSIGFISRWVADSYYSTDVLDKVYSKNEAAKMKFQGDGSGKNLAEYKKTSIAADFITQYNKAVKALPEEEKRDARKRLLDIINNWGNGKSASEEELIRLYDSTGEDMFITAPKLSISTTTGKRDMTADEYVELVEKYTAGYEALFAELIASEKYKNADDYTKVELLKDADSYALNSAKAEIFPDFKMPKWQTEIFEGKEAASETFFARVEADAFTSAKKEWSDNNFNFDESKYSEAEVSSMNEFEESAAAFYTSHEMNIPYEEGKYRRVQVYHDYLKDVMSLEEFAGIKAYANKVASTMGEGSTDSMSSKELQAYLNTLDYDTKTKGALFEAIADKGWKNPYSGGKVGDGTVFPVLTASPVEGGKSEVQAPESEQKTENAKPPEALPGGYTGGRTTNNSSNADNKVVTISYDASAFTQRGIAEIKKVESDANSYYNSPTQSDYTNNPLRHMHVYKTKLSKYMNLNDYAKIRAFVMESAKNSTVTADSLEKYLNSTDYTKSIKASLFEAIGDVNWVNPFK